MSEVEITLHNRQVHSVFELLGAKENDLTYSLGWALHKSERLSHVLCQRALARQDIEAPTAIQLQEHQESGGSTDIELSGPGYRVVLEAKRGFVAPSMEQLQKYLPRFRDDEPDRAFLVVAEASETYARAALSVPFEVEGVQVSYAAWADVLQVVRYSRKLKGLSLRERHTLDELTTYMSKLISQQDQESNMVFVVALNRNGALGSSTSFYQVVTEQGQYFHPYGEKGKRWPKVPPNYLGFRIDGRLLSIHHVESYEVTADLRTRFPEFTQTGEGNHIVYRLGPAIVPQSTVKTGNLYRSQHVRAHLDLLLTSASISEARDLTRARGSQVEE